MRPNKVRLRCVSLLGLFLSGLVPFPLSHAADAPYIDAKAVKERWSTVTPADMEKLRQCKVLFTSKSIGLNLVTGLGLVGKADKNYDLVGGFQRFDVEKNGGLPIVPADIFQTTRFVHILGTRYPLPKRVEELDELMRKEPWQFGNRVDVVMAIYAEVKPDVFPVYERLMDGLVRDYPRLRVIHATTSIFAPGPVAERSQKNMEEFNTLLRNRYRGKAPVLDLAAVLSDDYRDGPVMRPEYTRDPTGVHPSQPEGMTAIGRAFILALRDTLEWSPGSSPSAPAPTTTTVPLPAPATPNAEVLAPDHPEYLAVRAILDRNGLRAMKVEGQTLVRDGHVVGLFVQEAGITVIPDEIGKLVKLERLHCYGDRALAHPYLKSISPEIGKCEELEELLLTHNELVALPVEMTRLTRLKSLSVADNRLVNLPKEVDEWVRKFDPKGLSEQTKP